MQKKRSFFDPYAQAVVLHSNKLTARRWADFTELRQKK
jgi:hypothetical protein